DDDLHLPSARAPAPPGGLQARLRPPPFRQRLLLDRLRLRAPVALPAPGPVSVAQVRGCGRAQPAAAAVRRGVPTDAPRGAGRVRPCADPAQAGPTGVRAVEKGVAAPGQPGGPAA